MSSSVLLQAEGLSVRFSVGSGAQTRVIRAVDDVSFDLVRGEVLGVVGESGCGKSTMGKALLQLIKPNEGKVIFDGQEITGMWTKSWSGQYVWTSELRKLRSKMQFIFQDPYSSLNPRMTLEAIVAEPLRVFGRFNRAQLLEKVQTLLGDVGIDPSYIRRFPHEFSGGQRQRIGIARALAASPELIIADEPVSALDVSIQAQILNLLRDLQANLGMSLIFIAHDLGAVRYLSQRIAVMYLGRIVELGSTNDICEDAKHPYTKMLLSAVPSTDPRKKSTPLPIVGEVTDSSGASGCAFYSRCQSAIDRCKSEVPEFRAISQGRMVACHLAE